MKPYSQTSIKAFVRGQYALFVTAMTVTFVGATILMSLNALKSQHAQECRKLENRARDLSEIVTREAVIGSKETVHFELEKIAREFALPKLAFVETNTPRPAAKCSATSRGYNFEFPLFFGSQGIGFITAKKDALPLSRLDWMSLFLPILISFALSFALFWRFKKKFEAAVANPIQNLTADLTRSSVLRHVNIPSSLSEYQSLESSLNAMLKRLHDSSERIRKLEISESIAKVSSQVAHDIRSPLTALSVIEKTATNLSEDHRILARTAIRRIQDIANDLIKKSKIARTQMDDINAGHAKNKTALDEKFQFELREELISSVVDSLVTEKRLEYRDKKNISIESDIDSDAYLFVRIEPEYLARALSNSINNSIEALPPEGGYVHVRLFKSNEIARITVSDNGHGIPEPVKARLGERGVSFGKERGGSGTGLGVHFVIESIRAMNGIVTYETNPSVPAPSAGGTGTVVTIDLPLSKPPAWFADRIPVEKYRRLIVVDDDASIHEVWKKRGEIQDLAKLDKSILNFNTLSSFEDWWRAEGAPDTDLYLFDYEFIGQSESGLDMISRLGLEASSILTTSRFDDRGIRARCRDLNVKILPKALAPFVKL